MAKSDSTQNCPYHAEHTHRLTALEDDKKTLFSKINDSEKKLAQMDTLHLDKIPDRITGLERDFEHLSLDIEELKATSKINKEGLTDLSQLQNSTIDKLTELHTQLKGTQSRKQKIIDQIVTAVILGIIFFVISSGASQIFNKSTDIGGTTIKIGQPGASNVQSTSSKQTP
jgi:chromosome segregation ATPase